MPTVMDAHGPFDSGTFAEDLWREMFRHVRNDGVVQGQYNQMEVFADDTGMQVKVRTGLIFIQGHIGKITAEKTLAIAAAHATLARIDTVVARLDATGNEVELDVLTGTPAGSPVAPTLTTMPGSATTHEIALADVSVPATDTSIGAGQVTDRRVLVASGGGGGGAFVLIESKLLSAEGAIDFQNIPSGYRNLKIVALLRGGNDASSEVACGIRFNNDSGNNYYGQKVIVWDTAGYEQEPQTAVALPELFFMPADAGSGNAFASVEVTIPGYTLPRQKTCHAFGGYRHGGAASQQVYVTGTVTWNSTAVISRVQLIPLVGSFAIGSSAQLYGLSG